MKILIRKIFALSLLSYLTLSLHSQTPANKDFIRAVQEADLFFYFNEDFETAARYYEVLLKQYPDNCNISAKLGICYLNVDGKKADALSLLEKATKNVVNSDNEYVEFGLKAPIDTWFYLAHAYHLNDSLTKAIHLYYDVKNKLSSSDAFRVEYIDNQIKACKYAIEMEKNPVKVSEALFTSWLAEFPGATNPAVSKNDSVFVFTVKKEDGNHIFCSFKNKTWQEPYEITSMLSGYERLWTNSITGDGKTLILYMDDGADGNLYSSQRDGDKWSKIRKLDKNINTKYWEAHGFITPDGKQLFFSSNRPEGFGELDIWLSEKEKNGNWGPAANLGNTINTAYNDNTPFYDPDNKSLIFSSIGHSGMGGYDIYISTLKEGKWTEPIGLPYPLNSTSENSNFIYNNTVTGYITSLVDEKSNIRNIYRLLPTDLPSEKIIAVGSVNLLDGMNVMPKLAVIKMAKRDSAQTWNKIEVTDSGSFKFNTRPGNYQLQVSYTGYKTDTINLNIPDNFTGKSLSLNSSLIPERVSSGDFLVIKNILFDFNSHMLTGEAKLYLERLKSILKNYPELNIEVRGYTDIKGTAEYNILIADQRAKEVIAYLISSGISGSRFIKKAIGAADFVALNVNPDGSDNPVGRQYNRRVTLGIINPQTGIIIRQESYTPPQLRQPYSNKYSIVLMKSAEKYYPDYFRDFNMNELLFVRPVLKDTLYLYILGEFSDKSDAESYLSFAKGKGFKDAYIVNQYDLMEEPKQLISRTGTGRRSSDLRIYIIQLKASKVPINIAQFSGIEGVREIKGNDGYIRYVYGEFEGFSKAKTALDNVQKTGFKDAFIKEFNFLIKQ
jgi:outer membrane protein OmpA-like peptidoglycan-associated protein